MRRPFDYMARMPSEPELKRLQWRAHPPLSDEARKAAQQLQIAQEEAQQEARRERIIGEIVPQFWRSLGLPQASVHRAAPAGWIPDDSAGEAGAPSGATVPGAELKAISSFGSGSTSARPPASGWPSFANG